MSVSLTKNWRTANAASFERWQREQSQAWTDAVLEESIELNWRDGWDSPSFPPLFKESSDWKQALAAACELSAETGQFVRPSTD